MLGIAGWISPQELEKGVSPEICLEGWDLDLSLLITECVSVQKKKNMYLSSRRFLKTNVSLYIHNKKCQTNLSF